MKKVITLLSFLTIAYTFSVHTMQHEFLEKDKYEKSIYEKQYPLYGTIDQYETKKNPSECHSLANMLKQCRCYNFWTDKRQLKTIAEGICTGIVTFGIIEAFCAGLGAVTHDNPGLAINPIVLFSNGCASLMVCFFYVCIFARWSRYEDY